MADATTEKKPNILYPAYINKNKTVARGRRIPLQHAVADPKPNEVVDALFSLKGFQAAAEGKKYCREKDKEAVPWRIKYTNTNPSKNNLKNKREIMVACAKRINEVRAKSGPAPGQSGDGQSSGCHIGAISSIDVPAR
ncbi:uncharacterized protein LOC143869456 [Tasmannia lanceolata]|uniref:uncharacterized protein LOC143869456 n=1 Tax=Tasmannia lanceolata TaxID=3420 RepID=UPI004062908B